MSKYEVSVSGHEETLVVVAAGVRHAKMEAIRLYGHVFARMGWPKLKARKMTKAEVQMHEDLPHDA